MRAYYEEKDAAYVVLMVNPMQSGIENSFEDDHMRLAFKIAASHEYGNIDMYKIPKSRNIAIVGNGSSRKSTDTAISGLLSKFCMAELDVTGEELLRTVESVVKAGTKPS